MESSSVLRCYGHGRPRTHDERWKHRLSSIYDGTIVGSHHRRILKSDRRSGLRIYSTVHILTVTKNCTWHFLLFLLGNALAAHGYHWQELAERLLHLISIWRTACGAICFVFAHFHHHIDSIKRGVQIKPFMRFPLRAFYCFIFPEFQLLGVARAFCFILGFC